VQTAIEYEYRFTEYRFAEYEYDEIRGEARTATITEWPPKWFLKLSAADQPLRCMVLFWLFFVLVLVLSTP
jgi:hypothetical protein